MDVKEEVMETNQSLFSMEYDRNQLPDLLRIYYTRLFPYEMYYDWLCYGKGVRRDVGCTPSSLINYLFFHVS